MTHCTAGFRVRNINQTKRNQLNPARKCGRTFNHVAKPLYLNVTST